MRIASARASLALVLPALLHEVPRADIVPAFSISGPVNVRVLAVAQDDGESASGVFALSDVPPGAQIEWAQLYTHNWYSDPPLSATFAGQVLPTAAPFDAEIASPPLGSPAGYGNLFAYRWDVTALVSGGATYTASITGASICYGLALVVVFREPSLPQAQVVVADGALSVGTFGVAAREQISLPFLPGDGLLWVYTQADDDIDSGEKIGWNGAVVGGPLDAGLGDYASLLRLGPVQFQPVNHLGIATFGDWFGCHLVVAKGSIASDADSFDREDVAREETPVVPPSARGVPAGGRPPNSAREVAPPLPRG